jgi:hypothetical protein
VRRLFEQRIVLCTRVCVTSFDLASTPANIVICATFGKVVEVNMS